MEQAVEEEAVKLELKYCEVCGGLWLRPSGAGSVYCRVCAKRMAELPPPSTEATDPGEGRPQ